MRGCWAAKSFVVVSIWWLLYCLGSLTYHAREWWLQIILLFVLFNCLVFTAEVLIPGFTQKIHPKKK